MAEEKKGILSSIFGGKKKGCCCNMQIIEEPAEQTPQTETNAEDNGEPEKEEK